MAVHDVIQAGKYMPSNLYVEIPLSIPTFRDAFFYHLGTGQRNININSWDKYITM